MSPNGLSLSQAKESVPELVTIPRRPFPATRTTLELGVEALLVGVGENYGNLH